MNRLIGFFNRHSTSAVIIAANVVAVASTIVQYRAGTILAYGDAESHINIAKRVIDGLTPGFGQLGGVWLPLHHLLMVPFVASDFMWRSGLGGAVVSGAGFVGAATFVYLLAALLTGKRWTGVVAAVVFAANPNILYMLATPMSELPLMAFMSGSIYYFVKWVTGRGLYDLVLASALVLLSSLVRYDAWFLIIVEFACLLIVAVSDKWSLQKAQGLGLLFLTLALFGVGLWLLWSAVIFHDPIYFMDSPYSAKSQQLSFLHEGLLPSYHNIGWSLALYGGAVVLNVGLVLCIMAVAGLLAFCVLGKNGRVTKLIVVLLLISPLVFNVLSLFFGISILFVPGVTPNAFPYHLFNVRYGLQMVPPAAVLIALLADAVRVRVARIIVLIAVGVAVAAFAITFPITLQDGLHGLSARFPNGEGGVNADFQQYYDHGDVAFDDFARTANPISLGVPMDRIIYVGSHPYWEDMLAQPNHYARWIIIRKNDSLDHALSHNPFFIRDYTAVRTDADATIYRCATQCTATAQ